MTKVKLANPIKRGEDTVVVVTVHKPEAGALRGMKLTDVLQMDVNAMLALLPRVTEPALLPGELAVMDPGDFLSLSGVVVSFFMTPEQQAQLQAMTAQP